MLKSARKQEKDGEGRMPLADHLRELRNRLLIAVVAVIVITSITAFFYQDLIDFLIRPILESVGCTDGQKKQANGRPCAEMTVNGLVAPFSIALKVSLMAGVLFSTPVWLYQLWAFLAPGLHRNEKKYALSFVGAGVPLFCVGAALAYILMPQTAAVLLDFTPDNTTNLLPVDDYLDIVTRMVIVFGLAFELPLLLVLLNFTGVLTAKRLGSWWRAMIMGITVFAAVATPTGDPLTMVVLAAPIVLLYFLALGICIVNDRRRRRENPDADLDDDEASDLDLTPEDIGDMENVSASLPAQADGEQDGGRSSRRDGYDDIT
ncbi:twin-arginine translocase subunit TatC [Streptomyces sp. NPDC050529]|uniref:twin-arginine translocase subunit TatC n=1 Tax=unclassified Streptomyces TaxID=2593676 RepID=UPI002DDBE265|nr:twin-arginine translocase subunit TatC [Streptomyces sp. NBC_01022]MEE4490544.1 twin-arginine translocase subunit TatC [Streptomyces sp. BE230]WRZ80780.1 twin-arginine translocase subunit TatC [Streptomyces sp. NBC_01022]